MQVLWLADRLRTAGLTVVEHSGWQTRAIAGAWEPRFAVVHATAAPTTQSDSTQIAIVRDGRGDLAGPIAQCCVDHQGRWHVLGAGRCNTVKTGWAGPYSGLGNRYAFGVEACNDNRSEPWPAVQYEAYARGYAAILRGFGWDVGHLIGHKEHQPGDKTDPTFNMDQFRARVTAYMRGDDDDMFCKYGEQGPKVRYLQRRLNRLGASPLLNLDGQYGDATAAALRAVVPQATDNGRDYNDWAAEVLDAKLHWRAATTAVDAHEVGHPTGGGIAPGARLTLEATVTGVG